MHTIVYIVNMFLESPLSPNSTVTTEKTTLSYKRNVFKCIEEHIV